MMLIYNVLFRVSTRLTIWCLTNRITKRNKNTEMKLDSVSVLSTCQATISKFTNNSVHSIRNNKNSYIIDAPVILYHYVYYIIEHHLGYQEMNIYS